jgi:septum formation protein
MTAVAIISGGKIKEKTVMTQVRFRRLSKADIEHYIASGEWAGKAGGYAIQGQAEAFIPWISGSYSNVVGLPLSETAAMLRAYGYSCL